jgi:hypothetical protein
MKIPENLFVNSLMLPRLSLFAMLVLPLAAQVDSWDLPPVRYSDTPATDRLARLAEAWAGNPDSLRGATPLERARGVLAALEIPETSQVMVFSKTSKQNNLIHPRNPRAIYFSENAYCAYVPGGLMEVILQDPRLGPVFYLLDPGSPSKPPQVERDTSECMSCHATGRTENVPGLLVRSVYPDADGHAILSKGSGLITHQTPVQERWGGYYVTGSVSLPHLGNATFTNARESEPALHSLENLSGMIDTAKYPRPTSDIVALMVLEHQCQAHNLLTAASLNYKRVYHLGKAMNVDADPDAGSAGRVADSAAARIVEWFLFKDEAALGADGVEGCAEFQEQFEARFPRTADGRSLADFELNSRLFKYRCSYMIYSEAFKQLPDAVKSRVVAGLKKVLESPSAEDAYPDLKLTERRRIARILDETGAW